MGLPGERTCAWGRLLGRKGTRRPRSGAAIGRVSLRGWTATCPRPASPPRAESQAPSGTVTGAAQPGPFPQPWPHSQQSRWVAIPLGLRGQAGSSAEEPAAVGRQQPPHGTVGGGARLSRRHLPFPDFPSLSFPGPPAPAAPLDPLASPSSEPHVTAEARPPQARVPVPWSSQGLRGQRRLCCSSPSHRERRQPAGVTVPVKLHLQSQVAGQVYPAGRPAGP